MELSVRYYYVSVSYDKFIKRRFRSLRIIRGEDLQGLFKTMHHPVSDSSLFGQNGEYK
jgi:hypothetical protein